MVSRQGTSCSLGTFATNVHYDLPPAVKALLCGYMQTFQLAAIVSSVLAIVESLLLGLFKGAIGITMKKNNASDALLTLTYVSLLLSLSSAMSSLLLSDIFGTIPLRAARSEAVDGRIDVYDGPASQLVTKYNANDASWRFVKAHWIFTLLLTYLCVLVQIVLYAWCADATKGIPKGFALGAAIFAMLPLLSLIPLNLIMKAESRSRSSVLDEMHPRVMSPSHTFAGLPTKPT